MNDAATPPGYRVRAAAKVNLTLNIVSRRDDGYHLIDGLVVFAGIGDVVEVRPAERFALEVDGPFGAAAGAGGDNLAARAAHALAARAGRPPAARITLRKDLPVAAGLGGGSADAAATLRALAALWRPALGRPDLEGLALSLGADVPVCLRARPTHMSGIGEAIDPAPDLPEAHLALVNPGSELSTATVFAGAAGAFSRPRQRLSEAPRDAAALADWLRAGGNDLTPAACALEPRIAAVIERLAAARGCLVGRMSGSGPTCFGLFATAATARRAALEIAAENPGWWARAAPVLAAPPPVRRLAETPRRRSRRPRPDARGCEGG